MAARRACLRGTISRRTSSHSSPMASRSNPTPAPAPSAPPGAPPSAWPRRRRCSSACHRISAWRLSPIISTSLSPTISTAFNETLATVVSPRSRCVGSGDGWVAVYDPTSYDRFGLVNPLTGEVIPFRSLPRQSSFPDEVMVFKAVFAANPTSSEFTAAAVTGRDRVTYTTGGNSGWTVVECPRLRGRDSIADVVYHEGGGGGERPAVYCLTTSGDVHVLRLPCPADHRATAFEPLFDMAGNTVFDAAAAFWPPYDTIRSCINAKNLVVCDDGDMYQIWQDNVCAMILPLPGGGKCRVEKNQTFVLRYYPRRRPCWVAVKDLGGRSFFVGKNNAVALRVDDGGGSPGLRRNCVYWIDTSLCRDQAKVFDMVTGESAQCLSGVEDHSAICWYFLG